MTDPVKLAALLTVLKDHGVLHFRDGDLEISLEPAFPEPAADTDADSDIEWDGSFGLSPKAARAAGLAR